MNDASTEDTIRRMADQAAEIHGRWPEQGWGWPAEQVAMFEPGAEGETHLLATAGALLAKYRAETPEDANV